MFEGFFFFFFFLLLSLLCLFTLLFFIILCIIILTLGLPLAASNSFSILPSCLVPMIFTYITIYTLVFFKSWVIWLGGELAAHSPFSSTAQAFLSSRFLVAMWLVMLSLTPIHMLTGHNFIRRSAPVIGCPAPTNSYYICSRNRVCSTHSVSI